MRRHLRPILFGLSLLSLLFPWTGSAQGTVQVRRTATKVILDGRLNEDAWQSATPYTDFKQRDPSEGQPASEKTEVRFLCDDYALYVGVALWDRDPDGVVARAARRDDFQDGDYFQLYLDPYHDRTTGALFQVNAAGSLRDFNISNDTSTDAAWDSVWDAAVTRNEAGWFLEMEIPFSQLRFKKSDMQTWGVNMARFVFRKNETSWFQLVPKADYGLASRFADLSGIEGVEPGRNLEVLPYVRAGGTFLPLRSSTPANPFNSTGRDFSGGAGLDLKYGLRSNLTLNATINPDFAQVEVDPAVVNLSASETFFEERRPFFIEGSQIFSNFGTLGGVCCDGPSPRYFYSRRIGRAPKGPASGDYVSRPAAATILGAGKLTGKLGQGWTVGFLNATTSSEHADVINSGQRSKVEIEPVSNYTVGRVLREFGNRGGVGVLGTAVARNLDTPDLERVMPGSSQMFGGDGYYYFGRDRSWSINGRISGAWNYGSAAEIDSLQRAPQHYLQRPDATHLHYDPTATSMKGWAGGTRVGKISGGWTFSASLSAISPGFDVNDTGFQGSSDLWAATFKANWHQNDPDRFTRSRSVTVFRNESRNFNNDPGGRYTSISGNMTLLNYWTISGDAYFNQEGFDAGLTRGGPMTKTTADHNFFINLDSDSRKRLNFSVNNGYGHNVHGNWFIDEGVTIGLKPASSMTVSVGPNFKRSYQFVQYVATVADAAAANTYGKRYVFADLDQTSAGMTTRANWIVTPKVSVQVFQQLLLSVGKYWGFKQLDRPRGLDFSKYGLNTGTIMRDPALFQYVVDPDGAGPAAPFMLPDPSFNFKSLITNAVFRWEWKPGSALFVIWQQTKADSQYPGPLSPGRDLRALFGAPSTNVLLVKTTYWFNR